jgi:acylpyruvate hydrolase
MPRTVRGILEEGLLPELEHLTTTAPASTRRRLVSGQASSRLRLASVVTNPTKIICLGRNYVEHAEEQDQAAPDYPLLFSKGPNVLCGDGAAVAYPDDTEELDFEAEMAFVVGRRAKAVTQAQAWDYIAGYTVFIDLSARDLQRNEKQWFRGKSFDGAGPCGPWLVTRDEVPDPHALAISMEVDGETLQSSNTGRMTFTVDFLLAHISRTITLEPGDIVATGTPAGVGAFRDPPRFLRRGSRLEARVESIGTLTCTIA